MTFVFGGKPYKPNEFMGSLRKFLVPDTLAMQRSAVSDCAMNSKPKFEFSVPAGLDRNGSIDSFECCHFDSLAEGQDYIAKREALLYAEWEEALLAGGLAA